MEPVGLFFSYAVQIGILTGPVQAFYYFLGWGSVVFRTGVVPEAFSWDLVLRSSYGHLIA